MIIVNTHDYTEEYALGGIENPIPSVLVGSLDGEVMLSFLQTSEAAVSEQLGDSTLSSGSCLVEVRTDVEHEVAVCQRLPPHPHVIQILDTWDEEDSPVVVTEICSGGKVLRGFGSDVKGHADTALRLLKQMLAGVAHLHANGVCHRDLKPENLLMTRPIGDADARLVIIDFSMSALTRSMTVPCGSARYLAPEVISGRYGLPRDVWAVGVVAYELFWAVHPFEAPTDSEVIEAICKETPVQIPPAELRPFSFDIVAHEWSFESGFSELPESALSLMRSLLERDPALRPTAAEALRHPALQDIVLPGVG